MDERTRSGGPAADSSRRQRRFGLGRITAILAAAVVAALVFGYGWGASAARGWRELAGAAADSAARLDSAVSLPPGSEVIFEGKRVATLTGSRQLPREKSLGGTAWVIDGEWDASALASAARSDTTLIGVMSAAPGGSEAVEIELVQRRPPPNLQPRGILRLRPFQVGYQVY